eukprot:CAMPEP_0170619792 /NCGR_PEP_ID=MMETSP0224-20130122/27706_1 /TAXON_ID=285029 /ORGANISM="Togula jolla, Strain CCCM 725" /LENGTH=161 /DNA_ID=CAMNT_0010945907 /DNA_START=434 /DNA_END=918 /DNA_ORIENTATION=+
MSPSSTDSCPAVALTCSIRSTEMWHGWHPAKAVAAEVLLGIPIGGAVRAVVRVATGGCKPPVDDESDWLIVLSQSCVMDPGLDPDLARREAPPEAPREAPLNDGSPSDELQHRHSELQILANFQWVDAPNSLLRVGQTIPSESPHEAETRLPSPQDKVEAC